jgi:RNA polymerase sigma factor (sigma-70 family)
MSRRLHMSPSDTDLGLAVDVNRVGDVGQSDGPGDEGGAGEAASPSHEAAALAGDPGAWAVLIARHNHKIVVTLLARGIVLDQARELAQETWLRLMQQQRTGRLMHLSLPGLAIVQAGFLAANLRRQGWQRDQSRIDGLPEPASVTSGTLEDQAIDRQRLERLGRALQACPASARRVFEHVYDHPELSYAEVAPRVGLSVARVKQIVFEVRKRLRAALDSEESDDSDDSEATGKGGAQR